MSAAKPGRVPTVGQSKPTRRVGREVCHSVGPCVITQFAGVSRKVRARTPPTPWDGETLRGEDAGPTPPCGRRVAARIDRTIGMGAISALRNDPHGHLSDWPGESHTPLNGITGMTDLALDTDLTAEQREYLETVKMSSDSLLNVINDILDFSKIEAGKIDLEAVNFNLRDCLETTLETLALRADEKKLELLCGLPAGVPEVVQGDSGRLRQVVPSIWSVTQSSSRMAVKWR